MEPDLTDLVRRLWPEGGVLALLLASLIGVLLKQRNGNGRGSVADLRADLQRLAAELTALRHVVDANDRLGATVFELRHTETLTLVRSQHAETLRRLDDVHEAVERRSA